MSAERESGSDTELVGRPAEAFACGALGCRRTENLRRVTNDGQVRVLCPSHARYFAEVDA